MNFNVQIFELLTTTVPIILALVTAVHKHGERLGKIESKLDILYDDVRSLEKYN